MSKFVTWTAVFAVAALVVAVSAFGRATAPTRGQKMIVSVAMTEFKFTLTPKTARKGVVLFKLANKGALKHDLKINGKKSALIARGKTGTLLVTFKKAGRYPYLCTVPKHAAAGMKGVLVVK